MKKLFFLAAFVVASIAAVSQTEDVMTVKMKNGDIHAFNVEEIAEVTFQTKEDPMNPDVHIAEAIDLGLPSGTKWASWNIGASKPEEYGGYYAWGETEEKSCYDWLEYVYNDNKGGYVHIGDDIAGTQYDVAHVKWGGSWRMPTLEQIKELKDNCTRKWTSQNGVNGILVTGPNGNTIFLPAAGFRWDYSFFSKGEYGFYWSSTLDPDNDYHACYLSFYSSSWHWNSDSRYYGRSVRAVISSENDVQDQVKLSCPDDHHPHLIDLGLPSGIKWACCNVGASEPKGNGGYYAWGETEEKDYYGANTYIYGDPEEDSSYIGTNIAGTRYDVAYVKWGHEYEMATIEQFREVKEHCSLKWVTVDGKNGCLVTGPNGNSIFLPAAGSLSGDENTQENKEGSYWSSSLYSSNKSAYGLYCGSYGWDLESTFRAYGRSVRAVGFTESHKEINPEDHIAEAVDLGLPSGTKWASWNIGATKPEEYGGYYAWGETEEKDYYDWSSYIHCDGSYSTCHHIGDDIAGTEYDVAHVKWGGSWRMPSIDQFKELIDKCSRIWTSQNGVNGILVTGPNGNTIFLPAAGDHAGDNLSWVGSYGCYWSSSNYRIEYGYAYSQCFDSNNWFMDSSWFQREFGQSVRAVMIPEEKPQEYPVAEAIDLGLPSGTKWASWNVGASAPEEYGGYYAWGETEEKDYYYWSSYIHCDGSYSTCHHIGDDIAGTEYDVAHVKWGGPWKMPTKVQQDELRENCTREWLQQNDVNGIRITGPNGNSIFLPAAGYYWYGNLYNEGSNGYYWVSSLDLYEKLNANYLYFNLDNWTCYVNRRFHGMSVRPICP